MMMCRAATRLMSKQLDGPLSVRETLTLRVHVMMCKACRRCQQQFGMLHDLGDPFIDALPDSDENAQRHRQAVEQARKLSDDRSQQARSEGNENNDT
ncbi:zf-HC2 domain-containing protein [Halomonas huangheensis]|uniref:Putative zinc-finger domain-containing protein n=1 Tax=Halomonas huangheensis TaxID=1178482 RepID=W1NA87_9GAMM|nr:zf-HC2 domain-containing protein [Halomonas huangheensis]ALM53503.1 hypothetical protein AR456_15410 [Halomonas huangheensis]ERL51815.1 hypothetical protein BJB45_11665 [Halomonas huangheensis]